MAAGVQGSVQRRDRAGAVPEYGRHDGHPES